MRQGVDTNTIWSTQKRICAMGKLDRNKRFRNRAAPCRRWNLPAHHPTRTRRPCPGPGSGRWKEWWATPFPPRWNVPGLLLESSPADSSQPWLVRRAWEKNNSVNETYPLLIYFHAVTVNVFCLYMRVVINLSTKGGKSIIFELGRCKHAKFKGILNLKRIFSHVIPNLCDFLSSVEHKYIWRNVFFVCKREGNGYQISFNTNILQNTFFCFAYCRWNIQT